MQEAKSTEKQNESVWVSVYDTLHRQILQFERLPGEPLSENALATQFGTSRKPVRDAIFKLAGEGLVDVFPQKGSAVSRISSDTVRQFLFMRNVLESAVVTEACRDFPPDVMVFLRKSLQLQYLYFETEQLSLLSKEDTLMHRTLYAACHQPLAWEAFHALQADHQRITYLKLTARNYRNAPAFVADWSFTLTEHGLLLDAIEQHNEAAALKLVAQHVNQILSDMENLQTIYPHYFTDD
ncbi:MAG: GntR family transcriptional regulator [Ruthenibacterium sp.]